MAAGLAASGCQVTDLGVVPTPVLYYSVFHLKAAGGVMITGSHNPAEYNGFKVVAGASTIHGEEIQQIRKMIEARDFEVARAPSDSRMWSRRTWMRSPRSFASTGA